ncbi:MAG: branched-chain amino acid ABC transporter permease [Acidimicrobiaceae bacterium]|nr:branched-chain amino acid ABC transporter permease [Acidimicrobiaceae bacterium]
MSIQSRINNDAVGTPPELGTKQVGRGAKIGMAVLTLAILIPPFVTTSLELTKLSRLAVLVLAVLGVNLLTGYTGLISLGHGVFVGVGAFAMANFIDQGLSLYIAGFLATIFTGLIGLILGLPALRVRGLYLALVTFGTALAFPPFARRLGTWTGGVSGRNVDNDAFVPPAFLRLDDHVHVWRYGICIAVVALWFVIIRNLVDSRMGRALRTVRDNESAAATFGISVRYAKAGALAISAAMTGTAGVLQAILNPYISHADFDSFLSLRLYAAAVIGGLGTLAGAIYGVLALIVVPAVNGALELLDSDAIVFGAGLIIMTFVAPTGIAGLFEGRGRGKFSTP